MIKTVQISEKEAWDLAFNALVNNKTTEDNAKEVADALISAEFDDSQVMDCQEYPLMLSN